MTADMQNQPSHDKKAIWKERLLSVKTLKWAFLIVLLWFIFLVLIPGSVMYVEHECYIKNARLWLNEELESIKKLELRAGFKPEERLQIDIDVPGDDEFFHVFIKPFCKEPDTQKESDGLSEYLDENPRK